MGVRTYQYADAVQAAEACAKHIHVRLEEVLSGRPYATLAISGGVSPKPMFAALAASHIPWDRVHLFWVDERCVPPSDPRSNYGMAEECFLEPARVPHRNIHRIYGELRPELAAQQYAKDIRAFFNLAPGELPHFDVVHRGVGEDGSTASLFPGEPLIEDRDNIAAPVYVEKLNQWRVTLLPGVFLKAQHNVVYVTGPDKAPAIRAIFEEPYDPMKHPAQVTVHHARTVTWFLDEAAASLMR